MNKILTFSLFALFISIFVLPARVQEEEQLTLRLSRDFGYSSGTGKMQGTFSLKASGPENLVKVIFYIDQEVIGEASQAPFRFRFSTGNYSLGIHTMSANGYLADGRELRSNELRGQFVSADEGWKAALRIIVPVLAITFGAMLVSFVLPMVTGRRKTVHVPLGAPRNYGALGGTICPKCGRPFGIHIFGINLIAGKLDRCPYCGKWSLVRRASPQSLAAAEAVELEQAGEAEAQVMSEEERLRRELDQSRYQDL